MSILKRWSRSGIWPWLLAAAALAAVFASFHRLQMRELPSRTMLRIGMQDSPPFYFLLPNNVIGGPVYEIVQEAARRRNLDLVWVSDPLGPDHALSAGIADIWPIMGRLPSRLDRFELTESWLDLSYVLCSPVSCGALGSASPKPKSIAHRGTEVTRSILSSKYKGVAQVLTESHTKSLAAVCSGAADAALISETAHTGGLVNVPAECRERNVCLISEPVDTVGFGVGSRPGSRAARAGAILIREEFDRLIDDGTMAGILLKWGVSSGEIRALRSERLAQSRATLMTGVAVGLVCALLVLWLVHRRLLAAKREGERIQNELRASQAALRAEFDRRRDIENRYHQSQKLESLGRLAGGVAHDFNNLLTVVNGFSELLLTNRSLESGVRKRIAEISKAGARGADLTRQLLIYSRQQEASPCPLDLNQVVREISSLIQSLAGQTVPIEMRLQDDLGLVRGDQSQMNRLLMNLVVNARDAMPDGGAITIETANEIDPGGVPGQFVVLSVSDTGMGMDQATQDRIFEPFFTTKRPEIGTGMGLPIVQAVAHATGGWVDVKSSPGQGSCFRIILPRLTGDDENTEPRA